MIVMLLVGLLAFLLISAALAPMESLSWWAAKGADETRRRQTDLTGAGTQTEPEAEHYLVYLSGIGAIAGDSVPQEEYPFLQGLGERLPGTMVITDIYPYSVANQGLTAQRPTAWLWRRVEQLRLKNPNTMMALIVNLRNAFQLFVSADRRYGPVYNIGIAQEIWRGLLRHGYRSGSLKPVTLIGWSGGGQIAIGAAWYLGAGKMPLYVISLGGMLSDDVGLERIRHLWHLYGGKDKLQALGGVLYAGRWKSAPLSPWNQAMGQDRISLILLGPHNHNGTGNYFDMENKLPDGQTYGDKTLATIVQVLTGAGLVQPEAPVVNEVSSPAPSAVATG